MISWTNDMAASTWKLNYVHSLEQVVRIKEPLSDRWLDWLSFDAFWRVSHSNQKRDQPSLLCGFQLWVRLKGMECLDSCDRLFVGEIMSQFLERQVPRLA